MQTVLVTGANRGIGLEYCRQLQQHGEAVIAVCRTSSPELDALGVRVEAGLDLSHGSAIAALVRRLDGLPLDVVILNAGILEPTRLEPLDLDSIRRQFEVNALAPLQLAQALLPQLRNGSKL
ncbi:MAG: SDR family NAD(P)-dependent oxidoreductase, partial [Vulcanococcus sp.]